jgi:hypothetical protein
VSRPTRKEREARAKENARKGRERVASNRADIRTELQGHADEGWGTSPGAMGAVKMQSEEAKHTTCIDCGYSDGRHSRFCKAAS